MSHNFSSALQDDLVTVVEQNDEMGHFCIRIGKLKTLVTIELGRFMTSDKTKYSVSHAIKTPTQIDPYHTSLPFAATPVGALNRAVTGLTMYYQQAVDAGHEPKEDWLVED